MKNLFKNWMVVSALLMAAGVYAQPQNAPASRNEQIEALRVAYITEQLNLTPEEAQRFWPVYNQYKTDLQGLRQNFKADKPMTADEQLDFEQKKLDLKKKYRPQFEAAIGKEKMNKLYNLEDKFRQKLKDVMERRQEMRENGAARRGLGR